MKSLLLSIGLAISLVFNFLPGGNNDTAIVLIHGHESEIVYEISISKQYVDKFLAERGEFSCNNMICHIEH